MDEKKYSVNRLFILMSVFVFMSCSESNSPGQAIKKISKETETVFTSNPEPSPLTFPSSTPFDEIRMEMLPTQVVSGELLTSGPGREPIALSTSFNPTPIYEIPAQIPFDPKNEETTNLDTNSISLYENDTPLAQVKDVDITKVGPGFFSFDGSTIKITAKDAQGPYRNGKKYRYFLSKKGDVTVGPLTINESYENRTTNPNAFQNSFNAIGILKFDVDFSSIKVFENRTTLVDTKDKSKIGTPTGPPGQFSFNYDSNSAIAKFIFNASDNSDPNLNGRNYWWRVFKTETNPKLFVSGPNYLIKDQCQGPYVARLLSPIKKENNKTEWQILPNSKDIFLKNLSPSNTAIVVSSDPNCEPLKTPFIPKGKYAAQFYLKSSTLGPTPLFLGEDPEFAATNGGEKISTSGLYLFDVLDPTGVVIPNGLSESFNVRSFGIAGDSYTDDFENLKAMAVRMNGHPNAGIVFPPGTFKIAKFDLSKKIKFSFCDGLKIIYTNKSNLDLDGYSPPDLTDNATPEQKRATLFNALFDLSACMAQKIENAIKLEYPQNQQTLDYEGSYLFKVKPVTGATQYKFTFSQNNRILLSKYSDSSGEFGIMENDQQFHSLFSIGNVSVEIKSVNAFGLESEPLTITIVLQPRGT